MVSSQDDETADSEVTSEFEPVTSPIAKAPRAILYGIIDFFRGLGHRIKNFIHWLVSGGKRFVAFLRSPSTESVKESWKQLRQEMDPLSWIQLAAILVVFGLFLIAPLVQIVFGSFVNEAGFTLEYFFGRGVDYGEATGLFRNPDFMPQFRPEDFNWIRPTPAGIVEIWGIEMGTILNSIFSAIIVTIMSVILGTSFAFLIARYEFSGKSVLRTVLLFPMLSTPFIGAIGIKWFLGSYGFMNNLATEFFALFGVTWVRIEWHGLAAIILVQGLSLFSLVYLNAYSSFMGIDPSLEEQAENLGATGLTLFRSVTLPLAMPGIQAGAILTFILSIEDLGTPIVFGEDTQAQRTLAYQVFNSITAESGGVDPLGPAIGMVLLVLALAGFMAIRKYSSLRSYASASKGGQWNPRTRHLRRSTTILLYLVVIPTLFVALIPQISVIFLSFAEYTPGTSIIPPLTLSNYAILGTTNITGALVRTLAYGGAATIIIVLLGVSAAYIIARRDIPGKTALDLLVTAPIALPGIVIAGGYFSLFYGGVFFPRDGPMFLIIMSYAVRKFPFTVRAAYAGLQQTPEVLEEASLNVGASRNKTFARIVLPLIGVSVLAGSLLSFVFSVSEVSTSLLLGGANYHQAPLTWWIADTMSGLPPLLGLGPAAALGVLLMAMQMAVIATTNAILKTRASAMTGI
ncbi:MAG: ABC transporter permease [Promethearchaeota archaeon]